jgi:Protein of unknown function (DUF3237)
MEPKLEFAFEVRLQFALGLMIENTPFGFGRGGTYLGTGTFEGPKLKGTAVPNSGGDNAMFRPDGVLGLDARYMLREDDGTVILLNNRGYIWGRKPDTMARYREIMNGGPMVPFSEYYFRTTPTFEVSKGKHDWLTRYVFVGIGERTPDGNVIRYFALL